MVGVGSRWNKAYRQILRLRNGPGAATLPPSLTRIHLTFANNITGHVGPKKFWRECLRRLKFHNPAIPMIINRTAAEDAPATLTLYFRDPAALKKPDGAAEKSFQPPSSLKGESPAQPAMWDEKMVEIDVKGKHENAILEAFMSQTGAEKLEVPEEDEKALSKFASMDKVSAAKSRAARKILDEEKKAKAMLQRARAGAEG